VISLLLAYAKRFTLAHNPRIYGRIVGLCRGIKKPQRILELDLREALETTFTEERFFAAMECCLTDVSSRGGKLFFIGFTTLYR